MGQWKIKQLIKNRKIQKKGNKNRDNNQVLYGKLRALRINLKRRAWMTISHLGYLFNIINKHSLSAKFQISKIINKNKKREGKLIWKIGRTLIKQIGIRHKKLSLQKSINIKKSKYWMYLIVKSINQSI